MSGVVRWTFEDLAEAESHTFRVNPSEGGSPQKKKHVEEQLTVAPGGKVLLFEGHPELGAFEWRGVIHVQDEFETLNTWYEKKHQLILTDDLGREFYIYITDFQTERVRSAIYPWKHNYTMKALVLDWPDVGVEGGGP